MFSVCDADHDGLLSLDDFLQFAAIMSFVDEESVIDFVFQLCDMDGDGKITSEDLQLFVPSATPHHL